MGLQHAANIVDRILKALLKTLKRGLQDIITIPWGCGAHDLGKPQNLFGGAQKRELDCVPLPHEEALKLLDSIVCTQAYVNEVTGWTHHTKNRIILREARG